MSITTQVCRICKKQKSITEFGKNKNYKNGIDHDCKRCNVERVTNYYLQNPEKKKESAKKWNSKNRNAYQKEYYRRIRLKLSIA